MKKAHEALRQVLAYCDELGVELGLLRFEAEQALAGEPEPAGEPVAMEFIADLQRSRSKHPGIKQMFDGLLGEVHELKRAYQGDGDVRAEAFDVAVCAYRIATEGDEGENKKIDFVPDWMAWGETNTTPEAVRKLVDACVTLLWQHDRKPEHDLRPCSWEPFRAALAEVRASMDAMEAKPAPAGVKVPQFDSERST